MFNIRLFGLIAMTSLVLAVPVFADPATTPAAQPAVPASDHVDPAQARKNLAPLASAFGVKNPDDVAVQSDSSTSSAAAANAAPADQVHKTMGDVADRALTSIQELTAKVGDSLAKIAPQVWSIMLRQQIAKAIVAPLGPLAWLAGAWVLWGFGRKVWKHMDDAEYSGYGDPNDSAWNNIFRTVFVFAIPIIVATFSTMALLYSIQYSVLHFVNPGFYAIQDLLQAMMSGTPPS